MRNTIFPCCGLKLVHSVGRYIGERLLHARVPCQQPREGRLIEVGAHTATSGLCCYMDYQQQVAYRQ